MLVSKGLIAPLAAWVGGGVVSCGLASGRVKGLSVFDWEERLLCFARTPMCLSFFLELGYTVHLG